MVDFITKLLLVVEKNVILVVCDRLSKMTHFVAIVKNRRSGLNIFILLSHFYFIFDLVFLIPFLELGLGLE